LSLASSEPTPADAGGHHAPRIVQLVPAEGSDNETDPPKPPAGPRPSLKRVK
jgi:hypothetical protein